MSIGIALCSFPSTQSEVKPKLVTTPFNERKAPRLAWSLAFAEVTWARRFEVAERPAFGAMLREADSFRKAS